MGNLTIDQFCSEYHISVEKYHRMQRAGTGPRELRVGRRVLITPEARREWQTKLEQAQINQGAPSSMVAA